MKRTILFLTICLFLAVFITSCDDDDDKNPPVISNLEIGHDNNKTAYIGSDLHVEAEIYAEAKIASIRITIHPEDEHESSASEASEEHEELDILYTEGYAGVINTEFHEHIDIPEDFTEGEYHFHLVVTDMDGQQTTEEQAIQLVKGEDPGGHEEE
ncbi:MAG: DUF4625 domain-containing protein [Mangrovibacterium sp.]